MPPKNQTLLDQIKAQEYKENAELHDRLYNKAPAVSTATSIKESDRIKYDERNPAQRKSVVDFIKSIVSTDDTTMAEHTPIGEAITQIIRKYGDPYIMPLHDRITEEARVRTAEEREYFDWRYGEGNYSDTVRTRMLDFKHSDPSYHLDKREGAYPTVDTVTVPFGEDFTYFRGTDEEYSKTPEELLVEELGHAKQFAGKSARVRELIDARSLLDQRMYEDPHINPGTIEWQAHKDPDYAPAIWKEYRSILDSLLNQ